MKIPRTNIGCLNASTIYQNRTAQADQTKARVKATELRKSTMSNAKRQKINFPSASAENQWVALDGKTVLQMDKYIGKSTLEHTLSIFGRSST